MAINWPDTPTSGQVYTYGAQTWTWNGVGWAKSAAASAVDVPFTLVSGPFMTAYVLAFPEKFSGGGTFTLLTHI